VTVVARKPKNPQPHARRRKRREAVEVAAWEVRSAPEVRAEPIPSLQEALDGMVASLRVTQRHVDELHESELWRDGLMGRIPNEWIRLRDEYRDRVANLANALVRNGIADRAVQVQEARAALMVQMVVEAAERAGLSRTQVKALGSELRGLVAEKAGGS
jgi:hypothetical protein